MTCTECKIEDRNKSCDDRIGMLIGRRQTPTTTATTTPLPGLPGSTDFPLPGQLCEVPSGVSSNCMLGPPTETACSRGVRQLQYQTDMPSYVQTIGGADNNIGESPYDGTKFIVMVPSQALTGCHCITELTVTVRGSLVYDGPALSVTGRSVFLVEENGATQWVSVPGGTTSGKKIITTDGRCPCACVELFATWDGGAEGAEVQGVHPTIKGGQMEFSIPGYTPGAAVDGDIITVSWEDARTYKAAEMCAPPERCGQTMLAAPNFI